MKNHLESLGSDEKKKDDIVFKVSRRILEASYQHIVYNEFLPKILGDKYNEHGLSPGTSSYDSNLKPTLKNEFSSFAYRYINNVEY